MSPLSTEFFSPLILFFGLFYIVSTLQVKVDVALLL